MDWLEISGLLFLAAMFIFIFPSAKRAAENAPKGTLQDWLGYIIPVLAIVVFVIFLISLV